MVAAYADRTTLDRTGFAHDYSRSRGALWKKGEASGHVQRITELRLDCDGDTVLYHVDQTGPACQTGTLTCFSTAIERSGNLVSTPDTGEHHFTRLATTIAQRAAELEARTK